MRSVPVLLPQSRPGGGGRPARCSTMAAAQLRALCAAGPKLQQDRAKCLQLHQEWARGTAGALLRGGEAGLCWQTETWPHAVGKEGSHLPPRERCLSAQRAGRRVRGEQWGQRGRFTSFFTQGAVAVARGQTSAPCASPACDLPACCVQKS